MTADVLSHFGRLDELIQIIYQGFSRFIVLSQVNESAWTIHLALKGPEGRWWRGSWSAQDILHVVGTSASPEALDRFAQKLSETFVNGDLTIGDWSPNKEVNINITLEPTSKRPLHMPLVELSPTEAAAYAAALLSDVALQAQPRRCRLNPPVLSSALVLPRANQGRSSAMKTETREVPGGPSLPAEARRKIEVLESEPAQVKAQGRSPLLGPGPQPVVARAPKGASLANPHKKARKYQALEFGSDDE